MKLWITVEFDTEKESLLKGKSAEEIIEFVKNECSDPDFVDIIKLVKVEEVKCES